METTDELVLMSGRRIERSLKRIAHQILEANREGKPITLFGIRERGYAVAETLLGYLENLCDYNLSLQPIDLEADKPLEDDLSLEAQYILLVDDVIFSGTTMFKALNLLFERGGADQIHTVALVDRGHRKFPVTAEFIGMDLPTKLDEHVTVEVKGDEICRVVLTPSFH